MLIVPMTKEKIWQNPPAVTICIILINVFVFFAFQGDDQKYTYEAYEFYFQSGLAEIELPLYQKYIQETSGVHSIKKEDQADEEKMKELVKMHQDYGFMQKLYNDEIIPTSDLGYEGWREKRDVYDEIMNRSVSFTYGFKPAYFKPITILTSIFLHGSIGHLVGNMVFLWLLGCILETGCGRIKFGFIYLLSGACAVLLFKLVYFNSIVPLIGASGAVAGLMGLMGPLYGRKKIKVFYSLGFFFDYVRIQGYFLFPLWIGNEFVQLFWGPATNVAYVAHIGGLLAGLCCALALLKIPGSVNQEVFKDEEEDLVSPVIEKGLQKIADLEIQEGKQLLLEALEMDPDNIVVLRHLFNICKQTPKNEQFHTITSQYINALLRQPAARKQIPAIFKEYKEKAGTIKFPPKQLVQISFALCELKQTDEAAGLAIGLFKMNKHQPGLAAVFLRLFLSFDKSGQAEKSRKMQEVISNFYPDSQEHSQLLRHLHDS